MHADVWSLGNRLLNLYLPSKDEDKKPEIPRRDMSLFLLSKATGSSFERSLGNVDRQVSTEMLSLYPEE